jgi:HAD superfamily hydrolase (TIGR01509 family)
MRALFFDFDGLICDTERAAQRSWAELYALLGTTLPPAVWKRMAGRSNGHETAAADLGARLRRPVTAGELSWRAARKQALSNVEPLLPGVAELLATAESRGLLTAVVSSSPAGWVHGHLSRLGILHRFHTVITGDDEPRHKPAPDLYLRALATTGLPPRDAVAFEDSPSGVTAALAAGLRCVAVPNGAAARAHGLDHATLVLPSLADFDLDIVAVPT